MGSESLELVFTDQMLFVLPNQWGQGKKGNKVVMVIREKLSTD